MPSPGEFELCSEAVGSLPVVNHFLARMGLGELLERHLPHDDARLRLAPAVVIGLVVRNLIVAHQPVYALGELILNGPLSIVGSRSARPPRCGRSTKGDLPLLRA